MGTSPGSHQCVIPRQIGFVVSTDTTRSSRALGNVPAFLQTLRVPGFTQGIMSGIHGKCGGFMIYPDGTAVHYGRTEYLPNMNGFKSNGKFVVVNIPFVP